MILNWRRNDSDENPEKPGRKGSADSDITKKLALVRSLKADVVKRLADRGWDSADACVFGFLIGSGVPPPEAIRIVDTVKEETNG